MSGFDKIEFKPVQKESSATIAGSGSRRTVGSSGSSGREKKAGQDQKTLFMAAKRKKQKKIAWKIPLIVVGIIVLVVALIGFPAYATYKSGLKTYREAKLIAGAFKQQNIQVASDEIAKTQKDLKDTQRKLHVLIPLKIVPIASWYYNDADHLLNAAAYGLDSATTVTDSIKPYADVLGFKGQGSFAAGSSQDRIKTVVMTMGKITPQIDKIAVSLDLVQKEVDAVDPGHYPAFIFGKKVKAQLTSVKTFADEAATFVTDARPLVKVLPALLGESEEQKYLVLFQNDKELRPTGGFITGYSIFNIDKGALRADKSDDIYNLDNSVPNKQPAPAVLQKYLKVYTFNLRDSNLSPDFVTSMKTFKSMYDTAGESTKVNGIVAIDTSVLVSTIKILDDQVTAGGITFTTKNDPRCDCPQVIYELENNISRPVNYVRSDRKSLLGELLNTILVKALSSSPKIYWGPLFQSLVTQTNQKHVLFYLYNQDAQQGLEALNASGRIKNFEGDYLHINETNFSGAKVNIFMQEAVDNSYDVKGDGTITKTVTIHYKNPFPASDCSLARGGLCLNAEYKDWIRIYVPKGSELVDSKGSQVKITTSEDLGKTVFEGLTTVRPQGVGTLTLTYTLPFKATDSTLPVLIQKQPGTNDNSYTNIVNGKTIETFDLLTDKETKLKVR
jgi:hypothetical protein